MYNELKNPQAFVKSVLVSLSCGMKMVASPRLGAVGSTEE
jgi:hypothetical protein